MKEPVWRCPIALRRRPLLVGLALLLFSSPVWAASGDLFWTRETTPISMLAGLGPRVFGYALETRPNSIRPVLSAFAADSGTPLWKARGRKGWDPIRLGAGIAAAGERVFTAAELPGTGREASGIAKVSAHDAANGTRLWTHDFNDEFLYEIFEIAASADAVFVVGTQVFPFADSGEVMVLALDPLTGETLWSDYFNHTGGYPSGEQIAVSNGRVVVGAHGSRLNPDRSLEFLTIVRTYDAGTGAVLWQSKPLPLRHIGLSAHKNRVYLAGLRDPSKRSQVASYDLETGERIWTKRVRGVTEHTLAVTRGVLALFGEGVSGNSILQVLDRKSGRRRWRRAYSRVRALDVVGHRGRFYAIGFLDPDVRLFLKSYRPRNGKLAWSFQTRHPDRGEASAHGWDLNLHGGSLFASTGGPGFLLALDP